MDSLGNHWQFLFVNDLHICEEDCRSWFEQAFAAMKASAPDAEFCIVCGDLTDGGSEEQYQLAHDLLDSLGVPVFVVLGNHDYVTDDDRSAYEKYFTNQLNYWFERYGWQLIGLDTTQGTQYENTVIPAETLEWLERELPRLDANKPTIVFTHFPLNSNVYNCPLNANELLKLLEGLNIKAILSGHWHSHTEENWKNAVLTTNVCCSRVRGNHDGSTAKGWLVCELEEEKLTRRFVEIPKVLSSTQSASG
jgi:3',5'-cyclic AMP phosphodiesterase CpdA